MNGITVPKEHNKTCLMFLWLSLILNLSPLCFKIGGRGVHIPSQLCNRTWGSLPVIRLPLFFSFRSRALCTAGNMKLLMVSNPIGAKEDLIYLEDKPQGRGSELLMNQLLVQLQEPTQSGFSKSPRVILALTAGARNMSQEPGFFLFSCFPCQLLSQGDTS